MSSTSTNVLELPIARSDPTEFCHYLSPGQDAPCDATSSCVYVVLAYMLACHIQSMQRILSESDANVHKQLHPSDHSSAACHVTSAPCHLTYQ